VEESVGEENELLRRKAVQRSPEAKQLANVFPTRSEDDVQRTGAQIWRASKKDEDDQVQRGPDEIPAQVTPTAAAAPTAAAEISDLGNSLWWSFWDGPYGFSFS
jgi:hypothetical protein